MWETEKMGEMRNLIDKWGKKISERMWERERKAWDLGERKRGRENVGGGMRKIEMRGIERNYVRFRE